MPYFDGLRGRIHYRTWPVEQPRAVMVFLHGRGQHSGDYHRFGRAMTRHGVEVWAIDQAAHGLSEGEPGGPVSLPELVGDTRLLLGIVRSARPDAPLVLMGHSRGAAIALTAIRSDAVEVHTVSAVVLSGIPKQVLTPDLRYPAGPTLVLHGVDDRVTTIDPVREWASNLPNVDMREYHDAGHNLLHEPVRSTVTDDIAQFVLTRTS